MPLKNSTGSATETNVSGIAESCVSTDQQIPISPVHIATSRPANPHPPIRRIDDRNIPTRCSKAAVMDLLFTIGAPEVQNVILLPDI